MSFVDHAAWHRATGLASARSGDRFRAVARMAAALSLLTVAVAAPAAAETGAPTPR